ncbi:hypothetical protein ABB37_10020 [Leptomonas pyrrhocoris]|uniref:Uncharacterized protein n=1 Tax=Leptomonas pyrrhocoris TaxID=157538 RepID=A0A0N0DQY1_LEPPY|nr:hypothetical protein ABB37_10020 [Leptomonas pyrrhocoris]KPA73331.1 hypothetical protein ABB37_10020 [Leptomonas pyrrhocoris]|eukprot:XP_015651770.1 hypothetical protein ABB37_10020 [Leptomonas pyrrhocoris]
MSTAPAASAPPGGTPSLFGPAGPDMSQLMTYLPTILKVASQIPGILVGFVVTMVYMLGVVGRSGFTETVSPVAGFHLFVFFLLRDMIEPWRHGRARAEAAQLKEAKRRSFNTDIAMQYRETLD